MKVTEVKSENFKKLSAIDIKLDGKTVTVSGPNGSGKSSFIDAVWIALTGKDIPAEPIKLGEKSASIEVTVKDENGVEYVVEKQFHQRKPNALIVRQYTDDGKLGIPEKSPQAFLDVRLGKISFDPFEFINKNPKDQKVFLMALLGLDFSAIDSRKACLLDEKKLSNIEIKKLEGRFEVLPKFTGDYTQLKDLSEIQAKQDLLNDVRTGITNRETHLIRDQEELYRDQATVKDLETQIRILEERKAAAEIKISSSQAVIKNIQIELQEFKMTFNVDTILDMTEMLKEVQDHNNKVQIVKQKDQIIAETKALNKKIEQIEEDLETVEEQRKAVLAASNMPDPKLSFTEDGLLYDGLPFTEEQLNHAKIIEVGIGIQMALNPKLRIMRIKDASMLDNNTLTIIKKLAADKDYQLFIEKVADTKEIGFIIEEDEGERKVSVEQAMIALQPAF